MVYQAGFAMHGLISSDNGMIIGLRDALMTKAHAQYGNRGTVMLNQINADPGLIGGARTRRYDNRLRREGGDVVDLDFIVAHDLRIVTQSFDISREIMDEGIVIIDK